VSNQAPTIANLLPNNSEDYLLGPNQNLTITRVADKVAFANVTD
jgi:hypothetical protein